MGSEQMLRLVLGLFGDSGKEDGMNYKDQKYPPGYWSLGCTPDISGHAMWQRGPVCKHVKFKLGFRALHGAC